MYGLPQGSVFGPLLFWGHNQEPMSLHGGPVNQLQLVQNSATGLTINNISLDAFQKRW